MNTKRSSIKKKITMPQIKTYSPIKLKVSPPKQQQKTSHLTPSFLNLPNTKFYENHPYKFLQKIGQGAFAQVKTAKKQDGTLVVIKIYNKSKLTSKQRRKNVQQQINILSKIQHQSIIKMIESYQTKTSINIVMEYFSIVSLRALLKQKNKLNQQQLKTIIINIANALMYLKSQNIAHRDIKLQNILVDKKSLKIKIIDFGFATEVVSSYVKSSIIGTASYLSPEMIVSKEYDLFKADVWAFGILFYFFCTGYFPFRSVDSQTLQNKIVKGELLFPKDMNPGCQYLITKMLAYDQEDRIGIKEILEDSWIKPINIFGKIAQLKKAINC